MKNDGLLLNPRNPVETNAKLLAAWQQFSHSHSEVFAERMFGFLTSGSTSGVLNSIILLSEEALEVSARAVNRRLNVEKMDKWGLALPTFHVGGHAIGVRARLSNSRAIEYREQWNATKFQAWAKNENITLLSLVATQLFDLVEAEVKAPEALRAVVVGGGKLSEGLHRRAVQLGWPILQSYGLTECASQVATAFPGSDGFSLETLDHVEVKANSEQRLSIRSSSLLSARIQFDRNLIPRIDFPVDSEGWFQTSDKVQIEKHALSDGLHHHLKIIGRDSDSVKVMGELVDLVRIRETIEELANEISDLRVLRGRTWVFSRPHARQENELLLIIENAEIDIAELARKKLFEILKTRLAPFEIPTRTSVVELMPRSSLGKILSIQLMDLF